MVISCTRTDVLWNGFQSFPHPPVHESLRTFSVSHSCSQNLDLLELLNHQDWRWISFQSEGCLILACVSDHHCWAPHVSFCGHVEEVCTARNRKRRDSCHAKFSFYFLSFLNIEMAEVIEILTHGRQGVRPIHPAYSIHAHVPCDVLAPCIATARHCIPSIFIFE